MVQVRSMCRQPIKIVHRSNVQSLPLQNKVLNFGVPSLFPSLAIFSKPYHIRRWPHSRVIVWSCCVTLHIRRHWIIWLFNTIPYCVRCYNDHWILHDGTTREPFGTTSRRIAIKQVHWCRLAGFSLLAGHVRDCPSVSAINSVFRDRTRCQVQCSHWWTIWLSHV